MTKKTLRKLSATVAVCAMASVMAVNSLAPAASNSGISIVASAASSTSYTDGKFSFYIDDYGKAVINGSTATGAVTIPRTLKHGSTTYIVAKIGTKVFQNKTGVTSVDMSAATGLTDIDSFVFDGCTNMTSVKFPSSLKTINVYAFENCNKLTSLSLPAKLENIRNYAFHLCTGLKTVTISGTPKLQHLGEWAFKGCTALTKFAAPSEFANQPNNSIYLPKSMLSIMSGAFLDDTKLNTVYYTHNGPNYMCTGTMGTFQKNINFVDVDEIATPAATSVSSIPDQSITYNSTRFNWNFVDPADKSLGIVLKSVSSVASSGNVTMPATITYKGTSYKVKKIGGDFLKNNSSVKTVTFSNNIETIEGFVLADTPNLTQVTLPTALKAVGYASFYNCQKLEKIIYTGSGLRDVSAFAFMNNKLINNYETLYPKADAFMVGNALIKYYGDKYSGNNQTRLDMNCSTGVWTYNQSTNQYVKKPVKTICTYSMNYSTTKYKPTYLATLNLGGVEVIKDDSMTSCTKLESVYNMNACYEIGTNVFSTATLNKLKETTSDRNCIMFGTSLYKWLGTGTTADLTGKNITFIARGALNGTNVTTLKLPASSSLRIQKQAFVGSKLANLYYGSTYVDYINYKRNTGGVKAFYDKNYEGLEGTTHTKIHILLPRIQEIFAQLGLTYMPSFNPTVEYQIKVAGILYRYCTKNFVYETIGSGVGEYTLITNRGVCENQAFAYAYLLSCAGIHASVGHGPAHAWTLVRIGQDWYHADPTWKSTQNWFLRSTAQIQAQDPTYHAYDNYYVGNEILKLNGLDMNTFHPCTRLMGDINKDGVLDSTDRSGIWAALHYSTTLDMSHADLNGDGYVNAIDLYLLDNKMA